MPRPVDGSQMKSRLKPAKKLVQRGEVVRQKSSRRTEMTPGRKTKTRPAKSEFDQHWKEYLEAATWSHGNDVRGGVEVHRTADRSGRHGTGSILPRPSRAEACVRVADLKPRAIATDASRLSRRLHGVWGSSAGLLLSKETAYKRNRPRFD